MKSTFAFVFMLGSASIACEPVLAGDKNVDKKSGTVIGVLIDRTYGKGVSVKADGEEAPRRYWRFGDRKALNKEIDAIPLGTGHVEFPDDDYRHLRALSALEKLGFMENGLGDKALAYVGKLESLTHLTFGDHAVTDAGLEHLAGLKKLTYLNLCFPDKKHGGMISDKGMDEIAKITSLETLDLRATQITDAGVARLKSLPKLKELLLNNTAITDQGLVYLQQVKSLRLVGVFNCKGVTASGIAQLRKALPECVVRTTQK